MAAHGHVATSVSDTPAGWCGRPGHVVAGIAINLAGVNAAIDRVIAITAANRVEPLPAVDQILAFATENLVVAAATVDNVVAIFAQQEVVTFAAFDVIIAGPAIDRIVACVAIKIIIALIAAVTRLWDLTHPTDKGTPVFDEKHYAPQGWQVLHGGNWIEDNPAYGLVVHPPVGKWMLAAGQAVFGYGPMGWRIMPALCGIAIEIGRAHV